MNYHLLPVSGVKRLLNTEKQGLNMAEVEERLKHYGKNELTEKRKTSMFVLIIRQLSDVMIFILMVAAAISFLIGDLKDALVILVIVLLNAIIGIVQEYRADKAIEALKKLSKAAMQVGFAD